jgi:(S)-citramalyl-CoA lyase
VGDVHADALIVDLEDSVAPSAKSEARETALRYLAGISADHMPLALQLNSPETRFGLDDLQALLISSARGSSPPLARGAHRPIALDGSLRRPA